MDRGFGHTKDNSYSVQIPALKTQFNPVVLFLSVVSIATLITTCVLLDNLVPDELSQWFDWVAETWTWFHVSSRDLMIVFFVYLFFSRFSNVRLSESADEKPEFSTLTWFAMAFVSGASLQLFYFTVSDPISHYDPSAEGSNRFIADPFLADNSLAQNAVNLTFYHYGLHAWVVFCLFGLTLALLCHREGLPLSLRSCFFPLIGDTIYTWIGDVIDSMAVVIVFVNFSFQLCLSAQNLNSGLNVLIDEVPRKDWIQALILWVILIGSAVVCTLGLKHGISKCSLIALSAGTSVALLVFMLDNTWFLLNLFVQSTGFYLNWLLQLGTHTDAFEQHSASYGASERQRSLGDGQQDGPDYWFQMYTFTYWSWWLTWAPVVGIFLARISKGRTVREFITIVLLAPVAVVFAWISIFGGAALGSERLAHSQSFCCDENWDLTVISDSTVETSLTPLEFNIINAAVLCDASTCNTCATSTLTKYINQGQNFSEFIPNLRETLTTGATGELADDYTFVQNSRGQSPEDRRREVALLSCYATNERLLYLVRTYFDLGDALHGIVLFAIFLFGIASFSIFGFVLNVVITNGQEKSFRGQSIIWLVFLGGTSTAVIMIAGDYTFNDIANISYLLSYPMSMLSVAMILSLYCALRVTSGEVNYKAATWRVGFFDFCTVARKEPIFGWFRNIAIGPYNSSKAYCIVRGLDDRYAIVMATVMYWLLIGLAALNPLRYFVDGLWAFGWLCYVAFVAVVALQRSKVRVHLGYDGSAVEDVFVSLLSYPSVCHQLELELHNGLSGGDGAPTYREASHDFDSMKPKRRASNRVHPEPQPPPEPTPPREETPPPPAVVQPSRRGGAIVRSINANPGGNWSNFA